MVGIAMAPDDSRAALAATAAEQGISLARLSRLIGRNEAYLHQYVTRGSPRRLAEDDRRRLAAALGVGEAVLGGPPPLATVNVPRLAVGASAGPGRLVEDETAGAMLLDEALLRRLGVRRDSVSTIRVEGDSMAPTLCDGDEILVDTAARQPGRRGHPFVMRLDGALVVKRVAAAADGGWLVTSDGRDAPDPGLCAPARCTVIGRVVWLARALL